MIFKPKSVYRDYALPLHTGPHYWDFLLNMSLVTFLITKKSGIISIANIHIIPTSILQLFTVGCIVFYDTSLHPLCISFFNAFQSKFHTLV